MENNTLTDKIKKLQELGTLFEGNAISKNEFEVLKKELLKKNGELGVSDTAILSKKTARQIERKKSVRIILVVWVFIALITIIRVVMKGDSDSNTSISNSNNSTNNNLSSSNTDDKHRRVTINGYSVEILVDYTPPPGYEKGSICSDCNGTGVAYDNFTQSESVCAACMGKGFKWHKKEF